MGSRSPQEPQSRARAQSDEFKNGVWTETYQYVCVCLDMTLRSAYALSLCICVSFVCRVSLTRPRFRRAGVHIKRTDVKYIWEHRGEYM